MWVMREWVWHGCDRFQCQMLPIPPNLGTSDVDSLVLDSVCVNHLRVSIRDRAYMCVAHRSQYDGRCGEKEQVLPEGSDKGEDSQGKA